MRLEHINNCTLFTFEPQKRTDWYGFFDEDGGVFINARFNVLERECIYFHEIGHRICFLKKCKCLGVLSQEEYHALKYEFLRIRARNSRRLNRVYLRSVQKTLLKYKGDVIWRSHLVALRRLRELKMFKIFERVNE